MALLFKVKPLIVYVVYAIVILDGLIAALLYVAVTLAVPFVAHVPLFNVTVYVLALHALLLNVYPVAHVAIVHTLLTVPFDHVASVHVETFDLPHDVSQLVLAVPLVVPFAPAAPLG